MKFKRLIAREGLVILSIIAFGLLVIGINKFALHIYRHPDIFKNPFSNVTHDSGKNLFDDITPDYDKNPFPALTPNSNENLFLRYLPVIQPFYTIQKIGFLICVFGYPIYLLFRFIFWAVRTLETDA